MLEQMIDRADALIERHRVLASILASAWFCFGIGLQANFIELPPIPYVSEQALFWCGIVVGTLWWSIAYPRIMRRRKERAEQGGG